MPSTENPTLQRIQREISEVIEREKELKTLHNGNADNNISTINSDPPADPIIKHVANEVMEKPEAKPVLIHSKSLGAYPSNGASNGSNNGLRRFTSNPAAKGVMNKFYKSRGKITAASLMAPPASTSTPKPAAQVWNIPDEFNPPRVVDPSQCVRKGFVPVEEKLRKELEDLHLREMELRSERRKSQPDFNSLVEIEPPPQLGESGLKKARSMAQLYDPDEFNSFSAPQLKAARSLAELCDADEEELDAPGSHFLITRWEEMIQKNQQARS